MTTTPKKRRPHQLRPIKIEKYPTAAPGSVIISAGNTKVLCTASVSLDLPPFLKPKPGEKPKQGWVTAEYNMLPGSTPDRKKRGPDSRATEIQRLIGRCLRAAVNMKAMPGVSITVDCDVLVADGGTRTASITGGMVALAQAIEWAKLNVMIPARARVIPSPVAAVSVGIVDGKACLDLDYELDVKAEVDMNIAMNGRGKFIEVQGTAEHGTFDRKQLDRLVDLAARGIRQLIKAQKKTLR